MKPRASVVLILAVVLAACTDDLQGPPSGASPDTSAWVPAAVVDWLRSNAHPFATAQAGSGFEDLEFLREMIGSARVVALGEATHGTREFFLMKHRIVEFLVKEMDFNAFAIEATWPEANRLNDFVHTGQGDPLVLLSGLYFWTCSTEEVLDMIRWMREHNRNPGDARTVSFFGFDMQYPGMAIHNVARYLERVDPEAAPWAAARYDCLAPFANGPGGGASSVVLYGQQPLEYRDACLVGLEDVHAFLLARRAEYEAASSAREFETAVRSARILVQFEVKESRRVPGARDRFMAENASWLLDQAGPDAKIILWAHNGHVADDPYFDGGGSLGHHLRAEFGEDLVIAAFDFHQGEFQAVTVTDAGTLMGLNVHAVEVPPKDSYEYYFHASGMDRFILDLRGVSMTTPASSWLAGPRRMRSIGAGYARSFPDAYLPEISLPSRFDLVVYFDVTEAARPLLRRYPVAW